jgi:hypothetical protein
MAMMMVVENVQKTFNQHQFSLLLIYKTSISNVTVSTIMKLMMMMVVVGFRIVQKV